jgi:hypothetical protein
MKTVFATKKNITIGIKQTLNQKKKKIKYRNVDRFEENTCAFQIR